MKSPTAKELEIIEKETTKVKKIPKEYFLYGWTEREIFKRKLLDAIYLVKKEQQYGENNIKYEEKNKKE